MLYNDLFDHFPDDRERADELDASYTTLSSALQALTDDFGQRGKCGKERVGAIQNALHGLAWAALSGTGRPSAKELPLKEDKEDNKEQPEKETAGLHLLVSAVFPQALKLQKDLLAEQFSRQKSSLKRAMTSRGSTTKTRAKVSPAQPGGAVTV